VALGDQFNAAREQAEHLLGEPQALLVAVLHHAPTFGGRPGRSRFASPNRLRNVLTIALAPHGGSLSPVLPIERYA
jgi:hypothetical protein